MTERRDNVMTDRLVIPDGTQVVTRVARGGVPAGTVGLVESGAEEPAGPYTVRFSNGVRDEFQKVELVVRRRQVREELERSQPGFAELEPFVVYEVTVGSRAYGLSREGSDEDVRGVYLPSADLHWSLAGVPEQIEDPEADRVYWEFEKFVRLALQANPNILETLWSPLVGRTTPVGDRLRAEREAFLSRHAYATYGAYAVSQFKKLERDLRTHGHMRSKHAMHCIRLLLAGVRLLERGDVMVDCSEYRDDLLAIRDGQRSWDEILAWRQCLEDDLAAAYARTHLPERPDYERVDRMLRDARRSRL